MYISYTLPKQFSKFFSQTAGFIIFEKLQGNAHIQGGEAAQVVQEILSQNDGRTLEKAAVEKIVNRKNLTLDIHWFCCQPLNSIEG